jgi:hypothetical protein
LFALLRHALNWWYGEEEPWWWVFGVARFFGSAVAVMTGSSIAPSERKFRPSVALGLLVFAFGCWSIVERIQMHAWGDAFASLGLVGGAVAAICFVWKDEGGPAGQGVGG